jgi:uncharacterized membrane protein (UPF0127 family)
VNRKDNPPRVVYVFNKTRETFIATEATIADDYVSRLLGLLGKRPDWVRPGRGLWIVPSHGVHTVGMKFALDLIFLDRNNVVVETDEVVSPGRISKVSLKGYSVLEVPPHTVFRTGTQVGDQIEICRLPAESSPAAHPHDDAA